MLTSLLAFSIGSGSFIEGFLWVGVAFLIFLHQIWWVIVPLSIAAVIIHHLIYRRRPNRRRWRIGRAVHALSIFLLVASALEPLLNKFISG